MKNLLLLFIIFLLTIALPLLGREVNDWEWIPTLSKGINKQMAYQSVTLGLTLLFLATLRFLKPNVFSTYFRKGNISAKAKPEPWVGIKPGPKENWFHLGRNFSIIITLVTSTVIYFQLVKGGSPNIGKLWLVLPFSLVFSLINSFVEESITRLGIVVALKDRLPDRWIAVASGALFGIIHYWGNPGGIAGLLVAGFLGWFLAKSILETKGFFWAWFIHFLQDVVIITAILLFYP